jgi:hypothetical protein
LSVTIVANVFGADAGQEPEPDVTGIPAVCYPGIKGISTGFQEGGDVVSVVIGALVVIGPARGEIGVADTLAIEVKLVDAEGGGVDGGAADGSRGR